MLHFLEGIYGSGHASVWGTRIMESNESDWQTELRTIAATRPVPLSGQRLGGVGIHRTATGQPLFKAVDGAYLFSTYITTYTYIDGEYSFAQQVAASLADGFTAHEVLGVKAVFPKALTDGVAVSSTQHAVKLAYAHLADAVALDSVLHSRLTIIAHLVESLYLATGIIGQDDRVCWVANANTGAVSRYEGFNFNSFANIGGQMYGAMTDGIYLLDGNTDAGVNISSFALTGTDDFGDSHMKRVPKIYLGVASDGDLYVRTVTNTSDVHVYKINKTASDEVREQQTLLGRGVKSRYWQFAIENVAGSDFELESVEFFPVILSRHT